MLYLNKFLYLLEKEPKLLKKPNVILVLGLTTTQINNIKKFALENNLIYQENQGYYLTTEAKRYIIENPLQSWKTKEFPERIDINLECLKEEKTPSVLTRAIRNLSRHLIEGEILKENSLEHALYEEIKRCEKIVLKIENSLLSNKRKKLIDVVEKYIKKGFTKSFIGVCLLMILQRNSDKVAIYEKGLFQLKLSQLMIDRMIACPENFEIQKTIMTDEYLLKDISKIIMNSNSNNILEITKELYKLIRNLDKYTMHTQNLSKKTLRLRNVVINAKDPVSLFERDIPRVFSNNLLKDCDRSFLSEFKNSLNELKNCSENLIEELKVFIFESFQAKTKEELAQRFLKIKEYINEKELRILFNTVVETDVSIDLWINRIATFINKFRVPKDWNDEDYASFKLKTKELALKFFVLEATIGSHECSVSKIYHSVLNNFLKLSKQEQMIFLRKVIND